MRALLSERLSKGTLFVVKGFDFEDIKTKEAVSVLKGSWGFDEAVIVGGDCEEKFLLSVRNIQEFLFLHKTQINLYDMMAYKNVVFTEEAIKYIDEVLG